MAADNDTLVAITSLSSAVIAGGITLISKHLDNKQKKNEQAAIIKTTFISKKIEAGQKFVGENNVRIINRILIRRYLQYLKSGIGSEENIITDHKAAEEKLFEINLSKNNFIPIYFDIDEHIIKTYTIIDELNQVIPLIEPGGIHCRDDNYSENLDKSIELVNTLLDIYQQVNRIIREDLSKYDAI